MLKKPINTSETADLDPFVLYMGSRLLFLRIGFLKIKKLLRTIITFYVDGFRRMKQGRTLWAIIIIKLLIMFGVLKLFFFPDILHDNFNSDMERANHVFTQLTQRQTK
jgi:hypothetical protein